MTLDRHSNLIPGRVTALRKEGVALRKIADELGVSYQAVRKVIDPQGEAARIQRDNAKRRAAKRAWEQTQAKRGACDRCGGPCGQTSVRGGTHLCRPCFHDRAEERREEMVRLRRELRLGNRQIAERMGLPVSSVVVELSRARADGYDVPRDPYMERRREVLRAA